MTGTTDPYDVAVIGGGPAGATAAALLAEAGHRVAVFEKSRFPRFHTGESLLPATVRIFERLGLHDAIKDRFLHKPGGKWKYQEGTVFGNFGTSQPCASFTETPYSYMVERAVFDEMVLDRARELGAEVHEETEVRGVLEEGGRVHGLRVRGGEGAEREVHARWVIDGSGASSVVAHHFRLRTATEPRRMAIYSHYECEAADPHLQEGWFVGETIYDGWVWTIRLAPGYMSVGVVMSVDEFKRAGLPPEELLERWIFHSDHLKGGITRPTRRIGEVHVTGSMGHTSDSLSGDGWTLIGDAAYFVDPCWSSGVHLAMYSAEQVADVLIEALAAPGVPAADILDEYQAGMRHHERQVRKMVDAFYMASRNPWVQFFFTRAQFDRLRRKAVTFIGGDFTRNGFFIGNWYRISWLLETLTGWMYSPPGPPPPLAEPIPFEESGTAAA